MSENPERLLALTYALADAQSGLRALFALDHALGQLIRTTREPTLGQIRLVWWRDRLIDLDSGSPPAEPVLQGLAAHALPHGVTGAQLAGMIEGWSLLLEPELDLETLTRFGTERGALFEAGGRVLSASSNDPLAEAGQGWALADLATHLSDPAAADAARALARPLLEAACRVRWSRPARALGALTHLARMDLGTRPARIGAPSRVFRLLRHRLTGR